MPVPVLVSVTVAPGRIAPLLSVTVPRTSAVFACATTGEAQAARANKTRRVAATTVLVPEQTACRPVLALIHTHVFVIAAVSPPFNHCGNCTRLNFRAGRVRQLLPFNTPKRAYKFPTRKMQATQKGHLV